MPEATIARVLAWEALDSRGTPTVGCGVTLADGSSGRALVPSGASTGRHEAHELRDGGTRYGGRGVQRAVAGLRDVIGPEVLGRDATDQAGLDGLLLELDGTPDLSHLGGNAVLSLSLATARAAAAGAGLPLWSYVSSSRDRSLPLPMVNIVSGGAHAGGLIDIQDVLVIPLGASSFAEAIEWAWRVRRATAELASVMHPSTSLVADEGGLAFALSSNTEALDLVARGIEHAGLRPLEDVAIAVDVAAGQLVHEDGYRLRADGTMCSAEELVDLVVSWVDRYPLVSVEDPCAEDDWEGWRYASQRLGSRVQLLGDDLFATNLARLETGVRDGVANAVLVKPNQNGTVSGTQQVAEAAWSASYATVLSARSGDTEDDWLADLAIGWGVGQIKVGSTMRSERQAKWNRLLEVESHPDHDLPFVGRKALAGYV